MKLIKYVMKLGEIKERVEEWEYKQKRKKKIMDNNNNYYYLFTLPFYNMKVNVIQILRRVYINKNIIFLIRHSDFIWNSVSETELFSPSWSKNCTQ
jgi:hypothetical protein